MSTREKHFPTGKKGTSVENSKLFSSVNIENLTFNVEQDGEEGVLQRKNFSVKTCTNEILSFAHALGKSKTAESDIHLEILDESSFKPNLAPSGLQWRISVENINT